MPIKLRSDSVLSPAGNVGVPNSLIVFHTIPRMLKYDGDIGLTYEAMGTTCAILYERSGTSYAVKCRMVFTEKEQWWDWLYRQCKPNRPITIICLGLWTQLTWLDCWQEMELGRLVLRQESEPFEGKGAGSIGRPRSWSGLLIDDDPPGVLIVRHETTTVRFVDCRNWWNGSAANLDTIGKIVGAKLTVDVDEATDFPDALRASVEGLGRAVIAHFGAIESKNLGGFRLTAASQSWTAYRHRFMSVPILCHGDYDTLKLERQAYFGGRIHCRFVGKVQGPVYLLDCQSFYPSIMGGNDYPRLAAAEIVDPTPKKLLETPKGFMMAAKVTIQSNRELFPVRRDGQVIYACGRFQTSLIGMDLVRALKTGSIKAVHFCIVYESANLFRDYIDSLWKWRLEAAEQGDQITADLTKQLGRSLYGKFGQLTSAWIDAPEHRTARAWGRWSEGWSKSDHGKCYRALAGHVQEQVRKRWYEVPLKTDLLMNPKWEQPVRLETEGSMPAISAAITADGRNLLNALVAVAGERNVYYTAVDSLHVNAAGFNRLGRGGYIEDRRLGRLRIKHVAGSVEYIGDNHYVVDGVPVCAGMTVEDRSDDGKEYTVVENDRAGTLIDRGPSGITRRRRLKKSAPEVNIQGKIDRGGWVVPPVLGL